jgi:hypothetical protein
MHSTHVPQNSTADEKLLMLACRVGQAPAQSTAQSPRSEAGEVARDSINHALFNSLYTSEPILPPMDTRNVENKHVMIPWKQLQCRLIVNQYCSLVSPITRHLKPICHHCRQRADGTTKSGSPVILDLTCLELCSGPGFPKSFPALPWPF